MGVLRASRERIEDWWAGGYLTAPNPVLPERFMTEARASLPMFDGAGADLADVFAAVGMHQIRLRQDRQARCGSREERSTSALEACAPSPIGRRRGFRARPTARA